MYLIEKDPSNNRLLLTFSGRIDHESQTFLKELREAAIEVRSHGHDWDILADFADAPVLSQDRAENTRDFFNWCTRTGVRKVAFVTGSITQRLQFKRVTENDHRIEFFATRADAEKWLEDRTAPSSL